MQTCKQRDANRQAGMSLIELMVSTTIFTFVVVGATASAILFANVAKDHENRSDFASNIRTGMELMSLDIRNASSVDLRRQRRFDLGFTDGRSVSYRWQKDREQIIRRENGNNEVVFSNIARFDILVSAGDEPSDGALSYEEDEISIEELTFKANRGGQDATGVTIENFTFKIRNG